MLDEEKEEAFEERVLSSVITLEGVRKIFKEQYVLKCITLFLPAGKIYGFVGKNGSGKTVLFKTIAGFLHPETGVVTVHGKQLGVETDFAENIGLIIETPGFLSQYSAYKNLEFLAKIRNKIGKEEIRKAIELVGLDPDDKKKVGKYSLGMRQRLGIAQAIMEDPDILILDEPMNGLDKKGIALVRELLVKLKDEGKTILLASHYAEDMEICDELYDMDEGNVKRIR